MLVWRSTYEAVLARAEFAEGRYSALIKEWNELVRKLNARGGLKALYDQTPKQDQFSQEDIQRLLMLCHPDKHDGKLMANEMTARLLKLRK